jgi:hypothetical protein
MTAAEAEDGSGGQRRRQTTTTVEADADNGNGERQQQRGWMMTAVDDGGTQDWAADYEGGGREQVANNNGIRAHAPGREHDKIKKLSLCKKTYFSNTVCPVAFLLPPKHPTVCFRFISLI